jgi:hypothetical protein
MTTATEALHLQLIGMAQRNERVRCSDPVDHARWTSESAEDRNIAAQWCGDCQVLTLCGDAADERGEKHGVWGGRDLSRR